VFYLLEADDSELTLLQYQEYGPSIVRRFALLGGPGGS